MLRFEGSPSLRANQSDPEKADLLQDLERSPVDEDTAPLSEVQSIPTRTDRAVLFALLATWYTFTTVAAVSSKKFFQLGGDPLTLSVSTFVVGSLPLAFSGRLGTAFASTELLPVAVLHCSNTILTNLGIDSSSIRAVYSIKSLEPCLTAILDACLFTRETSPTALLALAVLPFFTFLSLTGDFTLGPIAACASLLSSFCVSGRTVFFKRQSSTAQLGPLLEFSALNAMALLFTLPFAIIRGFSFVSASQWTPQLNRIQLISLLAMLTYNCASFEILRRLSPVYHSLNNVLKRLSTIVFSTLIAGASLSPFTILGFGGVGASTVVWARNKTKRAPGSPAPPPSSRRAKVIVAATVLILACTLVRLAETAKRRTFRLAPYTPTYLSQCPSPANISAPLMYYKQNWNRLTNFGDEISPALVARMTGREIVKTTTEEDHTAYLGPRLLAIGSIVHTARACDIIWGTGVRTHQYWPDFDAASLAVHALRGPNSAHAISAASPGVRLPNVYGDPALLLPRYFPELGPKSTEKKGLRDDVLVLLHFRDAGRIPAEAGYTVLSALSEQWEDVVERITAASFVVSSSLHGLIVADAYGIPARGLQLNLEEPSFKYADYYLGTQRPEFRMANSVQEALWMGPEAPPRVDLDALVAAFPGDIIATV